MRRDQSSYLLLILISFLFFCTPLQNERPNILWIYLEDTSPYFGCYGASMVTTPNVDRLAEEGCLYTNVIMPAPVCSPCRSSIITGMMSTSIGAHNHHSSRTAASAIQLSDSISTIPKLFREAGYFTFNNGKDDYNFVYDRQEMYDQAYEIHPLYGKRGVAISLHDLESQQPFFGQIQLSGGKEIFSSTFKGKSKFAVDTSVISLPPYLPRNPKIVEEFANHLKAIQITDEKVGDIIAQLGHSGVLKNTIVFFFSDHGMRLTRHKQFLYEGGIRVPLIITDFRKITRSGGEVSEELISGLDIGPSSMYLAGIEIPEYMEGQNFLAGNSRNFVISTRDRCDFTIDRIRSVRSQRYKYIRNFNTDRPAAQKTYMDVDSVAFVLEMHRLMEEGKLNDVQSQFFNSNRVVEELYDLETDPFEINNLAGDIRHSGVLHRHAKILEDWIKSTDDQGQYAENVEGLKVMLGIWGDHASNIEYESLRQHFPDLSGSLFYLKSSKYQSVVPE